MDVIDGYNVIFQKLGHKNPDITSEQLRKERKSFVRTIKRFSESRQRLTYVVFDGNQPTDHLYWKRNKTELLTVMFGNEEEEADDIIIDLVESQKHANQVLVVTEDNDISDRVSEIGARIESSTTYLHRLEDFKRSEESDEHQEPGEKYGDKPVRNVKEWMEFFGLDEGS